MLRKHVRHRLVLLTLTGVVTTTLACSAPDPEPTATLAVPDRANATPWVATYGDVVVVAWGATSADGKTDVFASTSTDGGRVFAAPVRVNAIAGDARLVGESAPRIALGPATGSALPEIVVVWTARAELTAIKRAHSTDGGRTFSDAVALSAAGAPGNRGWAALAVDGGGQAHAIWLDHRAMAAGGTHRHSAATRNAEAAVAMAQKSALFYAGADAVEHEVGRGVCYCCKTALAASGDTVAAAWRHVYDGNFRDIAFAISRDRGRTFSPAARVSEDRWMLSGCPDDGPAMALDARGQAHIVWPTMLPGEPPQGGLFYATTTDGRSFSERVRIPTLGGRKPMHPQIAIDGSGRMAVAWDEQLGGERVAAVRFIETAGTPARFTKEIRLGAGDVALYPVLAPVADGFIAVWTRGGTDRSSIAIQRISPQ